MKKLTFMLLMFSLGCVNRPSYLEGTSVNVGLYLPYNGNIYGMQVCSYLNGCRVTCTSNQNFKLSREHVSTNSYMFGMIETCEHTKTEVETK